MTIETKFNIGDKVKFKSSFSNAVFTIDAIKITKEGVCYRMEGSQAYSLEDKLIDAGKANFTTVDVYGEKYEVINGTLYINDAVSPYVETLDIDFYSVEDLKNYFKADFYLVNEEVPIQKFTDMVKVLCIKEGEGFKKGLRYEALLSLDRNLLAVNNPRAKGTSLSYYYYDNVKYCKYSCLGVLESEFILLED